MSTPTYTHTVRIDVGQIQVVWSVYDLDHVRVGFGRAHDEITARSVAAAVVSALGGTANDPIAGIQSLA